MAALVPVNRMADLPAVLSDADPWQTAPEKARRVAIARADLIAPAAAMVAEGVAITRAAEVLLLRLEAAATPLQQAALRQVGEVPSLATLKRWLADHAGRGKVGLLPSFTGRVRQDYGWEARAIELYHLPSKPTYAAVALRLRKDGFDTATESRVARYLKSLPATLGALSPQRVGKHLHKLRHQKYQPRSTDNINVGEIYVGDGHTIDCYVAHPNTGKPWRPELTAWIDLKSRYITGWWLSESESSHSTLFSLSAAMVGHDHVPMAVYVDRGAGFISKLMNAESTGFYERFDIDPIFAIPGNPHGKGWIERFFRTVRDHHDKFFAGGAVYCGDDMAPEINRRMSADVASGKRKLPSFESYRDSLAQFIREYNATEMEVLDGAVPQSLWNTLERVPLETSAEAVIRPREPRAVVRSMVELHKRKYFHEALSLYQIPGSKVQVEYDLHNDDLVRIFDIDGRFVCVAQLVRKVDVLPTSRLEEARDRRLAGQVKRLERKVDEARARRDDAITVEDQIDRLSSIKPKALPKKRKDIDIDILDFKK